MAAKKKVQAQNNNQQTLVIAVVIVLLAGVAYYFYNREPAGYVAPEQQKAIEESYKATDVPTTETAPADNAPTDLPNGE